MMDASIQQASQHLPLAPFRSGTGQCPHAFNAPVCRFDRQGIEHRQLQLIAEDPIRKLRSFPPFQLHKSRLLVEPANCVMHNRIRHVAVADTPLTCSFVIAHSVDLHLGALIGRKVAAPCLKAVFSKHLTDVEVHLKPPILRESIPTRSSDACGRQEVEVRLHLPQSVRILQNGSHVLASQKLLEGQVDELNQIVRLREGWQAPFSDAGLEGIVDILIRAHGLDLLKAESTHSGALPLP
mmetsp:Transcript_15810/g.37290  ORF Transcript_15810/g.37290 Transcript_15810/m.37290 type:complete len:239 (+) Transcript_15810:1514-2230(+)